MTTQTAATGGNGQPVSSWRVLLQGFIVGVTNPKSVVFLLAILPQFVESICGAVSVRLIEFETIFVMVAMISDSIWVLLAGAARSWFATSPTRMSRMTGVGGGMMVGLGGAVVITGQKT